MEQMTLTDEGEWNLSISESRNKLKKNKQNQIVGIRPKTPKIENFSLIY